MNIHDTHVCAESFSGILPKESAPFVAKLASLNSEWRAAVAGELKARLFHELHQYLHFIGKDGTVHGISAPLGSETESFSILETHIDMQILLRATRAMSAWMARNDAGPQFPSVRGIFRFTDDITLTRNTALFLLANVWTCLKLPKCWGTSCDAEDMPYNVVDVALLTEWEKTPKQKALHVFWMFLFLKFAMFHWSPDVTVQLDTVKLLLVIIEVSAYLRYQMRDATLPLPPGLREQVTNVLLSELVELEDQGMGAKGALGQPDDADRA